MKRTAAALLWFFVGWYLGSVVAWALGLGPLVAPVLAAALAGLVTLDPLGLLWARPQPRSPTPGTVTTASPDVRRA